MLSFFSAASRARGVKRRRLLAIGAGSVAVGAVIIFGVLESPITPLASLGLLLSRLAALFRPPPPTPNSAGHARATRSNDTLLAAAFVPDRYVTRVLAPDIPGADLFVLSIFAWVEPTFGNTYLGIAERARDLDIAGNHKRRSVAAHEDNPLAGVVLAGVSLCDRANAEHHWHAVCESRHSHWRICLMSETHTTTGTDRRAPHTLGGDLLHFQLQRNARQNSPTWIPSTVRGRTTPWIRTTPRMPQVATEFLKPVLDAVQTTKVTKLS